MGQEPENGSGSSQPGTGETPGENNTPKPDEKYNGVKLIIDGREVKDGDTISLASHTQIPISATYTPPSQGALGEWFRFQSYGGTNLIQWESVNEHEITAICNYDNYDETIKFVIVCPEGEVEINVTLDFSKVED